jgi:hypothetical protein
MPKAKPTAAAKPTQAGELYQILITTPLNPDYDGTTYGVKFHEGQAMLNAEHSRPNPLGYSLETLADKFEREVDGYTVQRFYEGQEAPAPVEA